MKRIAVVLIVALAVFAGAFVCEKAYAAQTYPWNVTVDVVYRGDVFRYDLRTQCGKLRDEAERRGFYLCERPRRDLCARLLNAGLPREAVYNYLLPDFDGILRHFGYVETRREDAAVSFGKQGFCYRNGRDGASINADKLFDEMLRSDGRLITVQLPVTVDRALTAEELSRNTVLRGSFVTSYANSGANRCHNIARAAESVNGVTVEAGETFSFNETVGDRTEANGYRTAKVIRDGGYTDGVGGGVCQVSTTLYNALLLAGFVPKAVRHSLVSSYVKAGFDAMVSYGSADLTFVNDTDHPLYISATTVGKTVRFDVYGEPNPYKIVRESTEQREKFATEYVVDRQKYPELIYTDQTKVVVSGSDGVKTKSYLKYYLDGKLVQTKLIRTDSYKRVDAVIARGYLARESEAPACWARRAYKSFI